MSGTSAEERGELDYQCHLYSGGSQGNNGSNCTISSVEHASSDEFMPEAYLLDAVLLKYREYFHAHENEGEAILQNFVKQMLEDPETTEAQREWLRDNKDMFME